MDYAALTLPFSPGFCDLLKRGTSLMGVLPVIQLWNIYCCKSW